MKYDISICMPAHRSHLWQGVYESIQSAVGNYSWELIAVGPNPPTEFFNDKLNFKFLKDFGTPSRCGQIATMLSEGRLILNAVDDGFFVPQSIEKCIDLQKTLRREDVIVARYTEGINFSGPEHGQEYWHVKNYPDLLELGIPEDYYMIMSAVFDASYFRELGGWECNGYEHLNMNTHDLAFRAQRNGSKVYFSPTLVMKNNWNPNMGDHVPVAKAHVENDYAYFASEMKKDQSNRIKIDFFNWIHSPRVWTRRFGDLK